MYLNEDLAISHLYCISTMGDKFGLWYMDKLLGQLHSCLFPIKIPTSHQHVIDTASHNWWPHNVLKESGYDKLRRIAHQIHKMVKAVDLVPFSQSDNLASDHA